MGQDLRPRRICQQSPEKPRPSSDTTDGSGTAEVPEMTTLSKRQLPELLFKAVPWVLTLSAPVEAFTISMAKFGSLAAAGSLMVAVKPVNQSCPAFEPLFKRLSLTYHPETVLAELELFKTRKGRRQSRRV